jgi:hypothetical protein
MTTEPDSSPTQTPLGTRLDIPEHPNAAQEASSVSVSTDHRLSTEVAALTETPYEAAIDAANGLRGHGGRTPTLEDFEGLLTPAGNSGGVFGSDVTEGTLVDLGEDGATKGTLQDR